MDIKRYFLYAVFSIFLFTQAFSQTAAIYGGGSGSGAQGTSNASFTYFTLPASANVYKGANGSGSHITSKTPIAYYTLPGSFSISGGGNGGGASAKTQAILNFTTLPAYSNFTIGGPGSGGVASPVQNFLFLQAYGELSAELDNSFYITSSGVLYFRYHEKYHQATGAQLKYKLYDYTRTLLDSTPITKKYGMNYFAIPLSTIAGITSGKYYILEVTDDKGQILKLRFKYI